MSDGPEWDDREFDLVMPFVAVTSKGGQYDDQAFTAGYQMGEVSGKLEGRHVLATTVLIYHDLVSQLDLIAMRWGYRTEVLHDDDTWAQVGLERIDNA